MLLVLETAFDFVFSLFVLLLPAPFILPYCRSILDSDHSLQMT